MEGGSLGECRIFACSLVWAVGNVVREWGKDIPGRGRKALCCQCAPRVRLEEHGASCLLQSYRCPPTSRADHPSSYLPRALWASVTAPAMLGCTFLTFRLCPMMVFGDGNWVCFSSVSPAPPSVAGTHGTPLKCVLATAHVAESCCFCGLCPCPSAAAVGAPGAPAAVRGGLGGGAEGEMLAWSSYWLPPQ